MIDIPYDENMRPLSWAYARWIDGEPPVMRCPKNHAAVLSDYVIRDDGQVVGYVACPAPLCGFQAYVKLENYHPPALFTGGL